jgi:hypothetical protein
MSGRANAELWTDEAVLNNPAWAEVRSSARDAARLLEWVAR